MTDSDDAEMFDQDEEDRDLESQVSKGHNQAKIEKDEGRSEREATPSPQAPADRKTPQTPESAETVNLSDALSSPTADTTKPIGGDKASPNQIPEAALPEKLAASPNPPESNTDNPKQSPAAALAEKSVTTPKPT